MERKEFQTIGTKKDGTGESVTVYFGTMRGNTTWFAKNKNSVSTKIQKSKKGIFTYGSGSCKAVISDQNVIDYISKDFE
jgi:hypothetical protein